MRLVNLKALETLESVCAEVVAADDAALREMAAIGFEVPERTRELTDKLRAALAESRKLAR